MVLFSVYWSCQFLARPSNVSLTHWKQMGGMNIDADLLIDKSIHKSTNSRSSVLKVYMKKRKKKNSINCTLELLGCLE